MKLLSLLYCLCGIIYSADIRVFVDPDEITIAALVYLTINVDNIGDGITNFPDLYTEKEEYSVKDKKLTGNSVTYILQFWEIGIVEIPPIPIIIIYREQESVTIETDIIKLNIQPTLTGTDADIKVIREMADIKFFRPMGIIICILLLAASVFLCSKIWKNKLKPGLSANNIIIYQTPPFNAALNDINKLEIPGKITIETTESFYLDITRIFRNYINNTLFVKATEMTTTELKNYFYSQRIKKELTEEWFQLFQKADIVKYAGIMPDINQFNKDKNSYIELLKKFHQLKLEKVIAG